MSEFDEWKNLMKKLKKFTKDECKLMNKSDLIKYLLIWQECAHQALDIITSQDDIFSLLGLDEYFEDTELFKILIELKNEIIFIWTGNEFNLLGQVEGFENLINNIHRNIIDKNNKINLSYYKEKRK